MASRTGPRRLVFNHLQNYQSDNLKSPQKDEEKLPVPNTINIHSSSIPSLQHGTTYEATFTQTIPLNPEKMVATQSFTVAPSAAILDSSLVQSVYPPSGHSDYWNVLPHMLFNDPQIPWMMNTSDLTKEQLKMPWFGLLCFTHDELLLSPAELTTIATTSAPVQGPNLTLSLSEAEFATQTNQTAMTSKAQVDAIFIPNALFQAIFKGDSYGGDSNRFQYLTHVRTVNTAGMANMAGNGASAFAVSVSARPGPLQVSAPTVVYAHLVAIPPKEGSNQYDPKFIKCGLRSLYSWSYTCLPTSHFSITKAFQTLGSTQQPLRNSDQLLSQSKDPKDAWVQKRMLAGYSLARYRPITGETTMCLFRGPLIPNNPFDPALSSRDMPPSDVGTDLAIIDREVGLLDITFQLAWSLGRTLAMADRGFSAAWARAKRALHNDALNKAKAATDKSLFVPSSSSSNGQSADSRIPAFHPVLPTLTSINSLRDNLQRSSVPVPTPSNGSQLVSRWVRSNRVGNTRALCTFANPDMKPVYNGCLTAAACKVACCHDPSTTLTANQTIPNSTSLTPPYDELNSPASTDYALVMGWILDKWFLHGIPMYNLIPDPAFLPNESLRTFYIDPTWFKTFVDGALSLGDHFTPDDDARESLKDRLTTYLITPLSDGRPSPVPRWGFFIRSTLVSKFPNLRVSAPWNAQGVSDPKQLEVVRMERLDDDLLLVLFDRIPGPYDRLFQISVQPPEHQLCFMIGTSDSWSIDNNGISSFDVKWRSIAVDGTSPTSSSTTTYHSTDSQSPLDFDHNIIRSSVLADAAIKYSATTSPRSAALLGAQLVADFPQLVLQGGGTENRVRGQRIVPNSLSTSRRRVPNATKVTRPAPVRANPPPTSGPPRPSVSPLPTHGMLRSQYPALAVLADGEIHTIEMERSWMWVINVGDGGEFGNDNMWCPADAQPPSPTTQRLRVQIFNVHSKVGSSNSFPYSLPGQVDPDLYNTFAVMPMNLGILTDLNVSVNARFPDKGWLLTSIQISFDVGSRNGQDIGPLFMPFPTSATVKSNLNNSPGQNTPQDFEHRPDYQGRKLPVIRGVGKGKGWLFQTDYPPDQANPRFFVTAYPNRADPSGGKAAYDISTMPELAFVIEDVQIAWADYQPTPSIPSVKKFVRSQIYTTETYTSGPGGLQSLSIDGTMQTRISALIQTGSDFAPMMTPLPFPLNT